MTPPGRSTHISANRVWLIRALLVASPLVVLLALEATARSYMWYRHGVPGHSYGTSKYDAEFGAMPREDSYNTNSALNNMGFRNTEDVFEPKPSGALRVIAYGGSSTYCHHLLNDQAWPLALQDLLRADTPSIKHQVLNGGVIMWSLGHIAAKVHRDIPVLHPDYVLIYSGVNEEFNGALLQAEGRPLADLVKRGQYGAFTKNLSFNTPFRNIIAYKIARDEIGRLVFSLRKEDESDGGTEPDPVVLENYLRTLKGLIEYLRSEHVQPVFVRELHDPAVGGARRVLFSSEGAKRAAGWGAIVVDPSPIITGNEAEDRKLFQPTGIHYTVDGARKLARFIYSQVFAGRRTPG